jgi:hypothetical protein
MNGPSKESLGGPHTNRGHMDLFSAAQDSIHSLYHYQSFNEWTAERLERPLRERAIRMSKPSDFNDPWDCKLWFDLSRLDDPHEREQHLQ